MSNRRWKGTRSRFSPLRVDTALHAIALTALTLGLSWGGPASAQQIAAAGEAMGDPVAPQRFDGDLRELPTAPQSWNVGNTGGPRRRPSGPGLYGQYAAPASPADPLLALQQSVDRIFRRAFSPPALNFPGIGPSGANVPDTVGDVGPNHYIQMTNSDTGALFLILDKTGNVLVDATQLNALWPSGPCAGANAGGDGIVLYDPLANRWMLSQFSVIDGTPPPPGQTLCVAVSKTTNPVTGGWHLYAFNTDPAFPDYPKYGVWPTAYFVGINEDPSVAATFAFDRTNMLTGAVARAPVKLTAPPLAGFGFQLLMPSDLDGATPPPQGSPGYFTRHVDDESHTPETSDPTRDFLEVWSFVVDFDDPGASTLTLTDNVSVSEFDSEFCGNNDMCIPQPGTDVKLDPLNVFVMWRSQYRNFGTHQTLLNSWATDVDAATDGTDRAGVRWTELRKTGAGPWTLFQQGTYAPGTTASRWCSSAAMDGRGNIALGYSLSSTTVRPSMAYTGRLAGDPLGTMTQAERIVITGPGVGTDNRWGDYASMNVDPVDDCTFWYTNEFFDAEGGPSTQIASFRFPTCVPEPSAALAQLTVFGCLALRARALRRIRRADS